MHVLKKSVKLPGVDALIHAPTFKPTAKMKSRVLVVEV